MIYESGSLEFAGINQRVIDVLEGTVVKNRHDARVVFVLPLPLDSQPGLPKQDGGSLDGSRHKQVPSELLSGGVRYPLGAKWGSPKVQAGEPNSK